MQSFLRCKEINVMVVLEKKLNKASVEESVNCLCDWEWKMSEYVRDIRVHYGVIVWEKMKIEKEI